jgi:hypothetical protein
VEEVEGTRESSAVDGPPGSPVGADSPFRDVIADVAPEPAICRFLVRLGDEGTGPPVGGIDPAHACVALGEPVVQSERQQELVCLTAAHVNCPRYLRGVLLAAAPEGPPPQRPPLSPPVVAAGLLLVGALAASIGFLSVRGGLAVPLASGEGSAVAAASTAPSAGPSTVVPSAIASIPASPPPSASPSIEPAASPSVAVSTSGPSGPPPSPVPSSDRFAVISRCPNATDCWIYVVRAGDNLQSIVNWFGVKYATVLSMNPWIDDPSTIHAGDELRIPTPTR